MLVSAVFLLAYILIVARVFDLSVIQGSLQRDAQEAQSDDAAPQESPPRADISHLDWSRVAARLLP